MSNMSYCRFSNTLEDLRDCYENIDDAEMSNEEMMSRDSLLALCCKMAHELEHMINQDNVE